MRRNLHWVMGLSFGSLLVGCASESLAPEDGVDGEVGVGEQGQQLVTQRGCEGMSVRTPVPNRFKYLHVKAGTDTTIRGSQPTTNFQNETRCFTSFDDQEVCLVRFPIDLPETAQIHFAQLAMRMNTVGSAKFFASTMDLRWTEAGATWNVYKTGAPWTSPGAWLDKRGPFCTFTSGFGYFQNNLDGYAVSQIQDWVSGRAENSGIGIFADAQSSGKRLSMYSSENVPDDMPELLLYYTDEPILEQTRSVPVSALTTISQAQPTKNFASLPTCETFRDGNDSEKDCLVRWDLSQIPTGSLVTRVEVDFGTPPSNAPRWDIYPLRRAWVETEATWNVFATGSTWKKAGAYDSTDTSQSVAWLYPFGSGFEFQFGKPIYQLVQGWVNDPATNFGVVFGPSRSPRVNAHPWTLSTSPKLRVTFTPPPWQ